MEYRLMSRAVRFAALATCLALATACGGGGSSGGSGGDDGDKDSGSGGSSSGDGDSRPVAASDNATVDEDDSVTIDVLANDRHEGGSIDAATVSITRAPAEGTARVDAASGKITYTPDADFNGTDTLEYTVDGGDGPSSEAATVRIEVEGALDFASIDVAAGSGPKELDFDWSDDGDEAVDHYRLEVNPDGASGFHAVAGANSIGNTEFTQTVAVHVTDWVNALYRVVALDGSDNELASSQSIGLLNNVSAEAVTGYFKASNAGGDDFLGCGLALSDSGETLAVGACAEDSAATGIDGNETDNSARFAGAVYVFNRNGGTWSQQAYVKASNTDAEDLFGINVALGGNGDTLAVAAKREDSAATGVDGNAGDNSTTGAGAVYLY